MRRLLDRLLSVSVADAVQSVIDAAMTTTGTRVAELSIATPIVGW
jgi:hypothetical protein